MADDKEHRRQTLDELAKYINGKMGTNVLIRGSEARMEIPRITTGILALDLALGGGWPANQWSELVASESDGKTALAYKTIAANQALDPDWLAMWVAAEEYVPSYAAAIGVDLSRLWVVESNEMESVLELVLKAIENRAVDCIVIDSLSVLVTIVEADKKMDELSIATGAMVLSRFFKKSLKAQRRSLIDMDDRPCTMLALNQWRDRIGVTYGDPRTTPGGKAKNYYFFTRVEARRDEWIAESTKIEDRVGQTIAVRVFKNKAYRPQQVAQVDFYFADSKGYKKGQFDTAKDIVNVCLALDVFEGRYKFEGVRVASKKDDLYDMVRQDMGLQRRLLKAAHMAGLPQTVQPSSGGALPFQSVVPTSDNEGSSFDEDTGTEVVEQTGDTDSNEI